LVNGWNCQILDQLRQTNELHIYSFVPAGVFPVNIGRYNPVVPLRVLSAESQQILRVKRVCAPLAFDRFPLLASLDINEICFVPPFVTPVVDLARLQVGL
jgi:hypothetical protein